MKHRQTKIKRKTRWKPYHNEVLVVHERDETTGPDKHEPVLGSFDQAKTKMAPCVHTQATISYTHGTDTTRLPNHLPNEHK